MTTGDKPQGVDRLLGDVGRWAADTRATEAAGARTRERWLRRQAAEEATMAGIAVDLTERADAVLLTTTSGRTHRGRPVAVGRGVWVLGAERPGHTVRGAGMAGTTFVAADTVATLRAQSAGSGRPAPEGVGARPVPLAASMADVLTELAVDHPRVRVVVLGEPEAMIGELRSVGVDVATVRLAGKPPTTVYVRLGSVSELSVLGSG